MPILSFLIFYVCMSSSLRMILLLLGNSIQSLQLISEYNTLKVIKIIIIVIMIKLQILHDCTYDQMHEP